MHFPTSSDQKITPHELITVENAARHLGVSTKTVRNLIKASLLSVMFKRDDRRRKWVDPTEVEELRREREKGTQHMKSTLIKDVTRLRMEVKRLQAHMDVVLRILDSKSNPLRMTTDYAKQLYTVCIQQLGQAEWAATDVAPWVEIFLRLDEEDFLALAQATGDQKAWKPFLALCVKFTAHVVTKDEYATSLELQSLHKQLAEARRRLRVATLIYVEMYSSSEDSDFRRYVLTEAPASVIDTLDTVLRATPKKKR